MSVSSESILISAFRGNPTSRPPIWFMRQAGRYLPEYRAVREKHSMLEVIRTPELAAKVTLQPLDRFELDGAIIFADILNPLIGMGIELDFVEGEGPKIFNPIRELADIERLVVPGPEENTGYTLEAIKEVVSVLRPRNIPLLGFAGAPFTLAWYAVGEHGRSPNGLRMKELIYHNTSGWDKLMCKLVGLVESYLLAQLNAGAAAVQLFDSWVGVCSPATFRTFVFPYLERIISGLREKSSAPIIYFAPNGIGLAEVIRELDVDVVGVDWRVPLSTADTLFNGKFPLQGNLDPALLFAPITHLKEEVARILHDGTLCSKPHIFNLGHGILPKTPINAVAETVKFVREYSN